MAVGGPALGAALLAIAVAGCEPGGEFVSEPPPAHCSEVGAKCQLEGGPLGVCESAPCPPGTPPPCFVCTGQH